jgi:propanediol dehydratase large subunit
MANLKIMHTSEPEVYAESATRLNKQQVDMIQLLRNPLPEDDFLELRKKAVELLAKRLDMVMEDWENENEVSSQYYNDISNDHFRHKG